jgi:hypothetical protein
MTELRKAPWAVLALAAFVGCGDTATTTPPAPANVPAAKAALEPANAPAAKPAEAKPADTKPAEKKADAAPAKLTDDELAEVKKLSDPDQKLALAQLTCPGSGENLGGMGVPIKIELKGKTVFLCCKGCEKDALANPDATLAKLNKK